MGALPRSLDFLSPRSLAERLSCRREDLPLIVPLKDLTDNGLDESDLKDIVNVDVSDPAEGVTLSVTNTICGRSTGLTPEKTAKAINPDNRTSAKRWFMRVRRGANGGGLAYGIGISYAYSEDAEKLSPPLRVSNNGQLFAGSWRLGDGGPKPIVGAIEGDSPKGLTTVNLTIHGCSLKASKPRLMNVMKQLGLFNPNLQFSINGALLIKPRGGGPRFYSGPSSGKWFDISATKDLLAATATEGCESPTGIVECFAGLTSHTASQAMLASAGLEDKSISEILKEPSLLKTFHNALAKSSEQVQPDALGSIGRRVLKSGLVTQYGINPKSFKYFSSVGYVAGVPFVVEVALGTTCDGGLQVVCGVNGSPLLEDPFENCRFEPAKARDSVTWVGLRTLLSKDFHIENDDPCVIVVHITTPLPGWRGEGKASFDVQKFAAEVGESIKATCKGYARRKRYLPNQKPMIRYLRAFLEERKEDVKKDQDLPRRDRLTQSTVFYRVRPLLEAAWYKLDANDRVYITNSIRDEAWKIGVTREELGIFAADRAQLYFRGNVFAINYENIVELMKMGTDLLIIEKEGVAEVLAPYAAKYGIAILNSRGFLVEYAKLLSKAARENGCNVVIITDMDASGLAIVADLRKAGIAVRRIAVDFDTLSAMHLDIKEVEEAYEPSQGHLNKAIEEFGADTALVDYVETKRVEIDSVIARTSSEQFWDYVFEALGKAYPQRDYNRAISLPEAAMPEELRGLFEKAERIVATSTAVRRDSLMKGLTSYSGFIDVEAFEAEATKELESVALADPRVRKLQDGLQKVIEDASGSLQDGGENG